MDGVRPRTSEAIDYWPSLKLSIMQSIKQIPHVTKKDLQESIYTGMDNLFVHQLLGL